MFEISFWELTLCFVIALIVLGPERLPPIAKALGRWTGQARVYLRNLGSELERETQASELKRQLEEAKRAYEEQSLAIKKEVAQLAAPVTPPASEHSKTP